MSDTERAWAAGFFDGEGYCGYSEKWDRRHNSYSRRLVVTIAQNDPELLYRFATVVGVGNVRGPYRGHNPRAQEHYQFSVAGRSAVGQMLERIGPWIGSIKSAQIETALAAFDAYDPPRAHCEHGVRRQKCTTCRSAWVTAGWARRRAEA